MKYLNLLLLFLLTTFAANAQTPAHVTTELKKGILVLDSAKLTAQFLTAAKQFDNIAGKQPKEWLPLYYQAYSNLLAGITSKGTVAQKDSLFDKALSYTAKADALQPNNSELYVLKGYITFMKMSVVPQARAMQMIPEAEGYLIKAAELDPENPRAYLIRGQNSFYTPEFFGGGKDVAKPFLTTAAQKFTKQTAKGAEPAWGNARCNTLLKQCQ